MPQETKVSYQALWGEADIKGEGTVREGRGAEGEAVGAEGEAAGAERQQEKRKAVLHCNRGVGQICLTLWRT